MIDVDTTHIVTKTKKGSWSDNPFGFSDYNCATNTLFFVAVSYETMRYCWTESGLIGPDKTRLVKEMLNLSPKIESSVKLWRTELESILGPPQFPRDEECPHCKGSGKTNHFCSCKLCKEILQECDWCEGKKVVIEFPDQRPTEFYGVVFDAAFLAIAIDAIKDRNRELTISLVSLRGSDVILVLCEDWRIVLSAMKKDSIEEDVRQFATFGLA